MRTTKSLRAFTAEHKISVFVCLSDTSVCVGVRGAVGVRPHTLLDLSAWGVRSRCYPEACRRRGSEGSSCGALSDARPESALIAKVQPCLS